MVLRKSAHLLYKSRYECVFCVERISIKQGKGLRFCLFFLFAASISFYRFTKIRVTLQNIGEGFKLIGIHLGEVDFEEFAVHNHLSVRCIIGSL